MTRTIQILRGTEAQNDAFTGAIGELTMDTTNNEIRIHDGSTVGGHKIGGSVAIDNSTITKNASDEIQAVAVIDQNTGIAKTWTGTQAEYDAIVTKDPETEYIITDDIGGPATVIAELAEGLNGKADVSTVAHVVVEFQEPTSANGYTWYRKYADGWVEQGGRTGGIANNSDCAITFPVVMSNTYYVLTLGQELSTSVVYDSRHAVIRADSRTTTGVSIRNARFAGNEGNNMAINWQVSGMAA